VFWASWWELRKYSKWKCIMCLRWSCCHELYLFSQSGECMCLIALLCILCLVSHACTLLVAGTKKLQQTYLMLCCCDCTAQTWQIQVMKLHAEQNQLPKGGWIFELFDFLLTCARRHLISDAAVRMRVKCPQQVWSCLYSAWCMRAEDLLAAGCSK